MKTANYFIEKLELEKHPEGGWFKQVYKSEEEIDKEHLPNRYSGKRAHSTSIYFLITQEEFSAFHRIKSDELWHFYEGSPLTIHIINDAGKYSNVKLGNNLENGNVYQYAIPHGVWFAATVNNIAADSYSLIGCTVSPGFDYDDFELGKQDELVKMFPNHKIIIEKMTRS